MKVKLLIDNIEIVADISKEEYEKIKVLEHVEKLTGYESKLGNSISNKYYYIDDSSAAHVETDFDTNTSTDCNRYNYANYYSDKTVAKNNARADTLIRQLRRFAIENSENNLDWKNPMQIKFYITFNNNSKELDINISYCSTVKILGVIFFDSNELAQKAINEFKDELIWYFTKYKDSI